MGSIRAMAFRWAWVPLVVAACKPPPESDVAAVDGSGITRQLATVELRACLWRRGENWETLTEDVKQVRRQEAVDACVERLLLAGFSATTATGPGLVRESEDAFQQFLKQFEPPEGWKPRLEWQGLTEPQMRERITAEVVQGSAIESWLQQQALHGGLPGEDAARAWFETHKEQLRIPERVRVSHVFLSGHDREKPDRTAEVTELHRKLVAGEAALAQLAAKASEDERSRKRGGELGWISRERVPEDLAQRVFSLPVAQLSAPFQTRLGWHIAIVHEKRPSRLPEFSEVRAEVMAMLDQQWRESALKRLKQELREKARITLNDAALRMLEPDL